MTDEKGLSAGIEDFVQRMMTHMGWALAVRVEEPDEETLRVDLSGEDRDLVLENRAEILEVLQYLLNRIFS
ncbi:MAG: hypothetical protein ACRD21_13065, partial [Vicinamibacteria bacterium]